MLEGTVLLCHREGTLSPESRLTSMTVERGLQVSAFARLLTTITLDVGRARLAH